jgi:hypothetical protein
MCDQTTNDSRLCNFLFFYNTLLLVFVFHGTNNGSNLLYDSDLETTEKHIFVNMKLWERC